MPPARRCVPRLDVAGAGGELRCRGEGSLVHWWLCLGSTERATHRQETIQRPLGWQLAVITRFRVCLLASTCQLGRCTWSSFHCTHHLPRSAWGWPHLPKSSARICHRPIWLPPQAQQPPGQAGGGHTCLGKEPVAQDDGLGCTGAWSVGRSVGRSVSWLEPCPGFPTDPGLKGSSPCAMQG